MNSQKIYITSTTPIGSHCLEWAKHNYPQVRIVTDMNECDIFFSVFFNKIMSQEFIASKVRCFNFHGGILPEYRGSGIYNWAIMNGETETGVTLHELDERIDHGPVIDVRKFKIEENDTTDDLFKKAEKTTIQMFQHWFTALINLDYNATPQDESKAKLYSRADLQKARNLTRFARAFQTAGYEQAYYSDRSGKKKYIEW
jgi:methionyl-tRNA formyltransferase